MQDTAIDGEIRSFSDAIHCRIKFELSKETISYTLHSPIVDQYRTHNDSFTNGMLDGRQETIIQNQIMAFVGLNNESDRVAVRMSLGQICDEVREHDEYFSLSTRGGKWCGFEVPAGYNIEDGCIRLEKYSGDEPYYITFCRTPCIPIATGQNIDTNEYWVNLQFTNIYNHPHSEWLSQQDALSRKGIMKMADKGVNLIEKDSSTMNAYISSCLQVNRFEMPRKLVTEKNGWKMDNTIFAFGKRGFMQGGTAGIVPIRKEASAGLHVCGSMDAWIDAAEPIIDNPLVRMKMYAVCTAPLLRLLNVQSFILDHNGESSTGKTFTNDFGMSLIGDADTLRFNGDTTKTAAEILAEIYTDLPLYLDETGTQQSDEVLKALIYMLANEQGRMRGHKDGGLRDTGKWKTVALTTGERPLTSHRSYSGQNVRVIEIRGGLSKDVIDDVKHAADVRVENYGHFAEPYFDRVFEYKNNLNEMYQMARERYATKDSVKTNRLAGSFAAITVAGMILEDVFNDVGITPIQPHDVIDKYFDMCVDFDVTENYSTRALQVVMDWITTKNSCFIDSDNPNTMRTNEFFGWIDSEYIDVVPAALRKALEQHGYDSTRARNDWIDDGVVKVNTGRKDYKASHNGQDKKVIRFVRSRVNDLLFA